MNISFYCIQNHVISKAFNIVKYDIIQTNFFIIIAKFLCFAIKIYCTAKILS